MDEKFENFHLEDLHKKGLLDSPGRLQKSVETSLNALNRYFSKSKGKIEKYLSKEIMDDETR